MVSGAEAIILPIAASHWARQRPRPGGGIIAGEHDSRPGMP